MLPTHRKARADCAADQGNGRSAQVRGPRCTWRVGPEILRHGTLLTDPWAMDDEHERRALAGVRERLCERYPDLDPALVEAAVRVSHLELTGNPIRDFVPLLVEHAARDRLAFAIHNPSTDDAPSPDPQSAPPHDDGVPTASLHDVEEAV